MCRDVVKDLSAYLRMVANPLDDTAICRVRSIDSCALTQHDWASVCRFSGGEGCSSAGRWLFSSWGVFTGWETVMDFTVAPEVVQEVRTYFLLCIPLLEHVLD